METTALPRAIWDRIDAGQKRPREEQDAKERSRKDRAALLRQAVQQAGTIPEELRPHCVCKLTDTEWAEVRVIHPGLAPVVMQWHYWPPAAPDAMWVHWPWQAIPRLDYAVPPRPGAPKKDWHYAATIDAALALAYDFGPAWRLSLDEAKALRPWWRRWLGV